MSRSSCDTTSARIAVKLLYLHIGQIRWSPLMILNIVNILGLFQPLLLQPCQGFVESHQILEGSLTGFGATAQ
jgi:hypothetical protein